MKKIVVVSIFITLNCICIAQSGLTLNLKGGGGLTTLLSKSFANNRPDNHMFEKQDLFGSVLGLELGYGFKYSPISISAGYLMRTHQFKYAVNMIPISGVYDVEYSMKSADIPIIIRYKPSKQSKSSEVYGKGAFYEVGVQISSMSEINMQTTYDFVSNEVEDVRPYFETSNIDLVVGFGIVQFGYDKMAISHTVRGSYGLSNVRKDDNFYPFDDDNYKAYFIDRHPINLITVQYMLTIILKAPSKMLDKF